MKYFIQMLMANLLTWIEIERNPMFHDIYIDCFEEQKEKLLLFTAQERA